MSGGVETVTAFTSTAIQAAITAVQAGSGGQGGVVLLPPGAYACTATITLPSKVTLQGSGKQTTLLIAQSDITVLDIIGTASANAPGGIGNHIASPIVQDLQIQGGNNTAWSTKPMVRLYYVHTAEFNSVTFSNKYGIATLVGAECWDCTWRECRWDNCGGINQGLPAMLIQSADGATFPAFGSSTDATNDQRFYHCTWESFRDGAIWTAMPTGAQPIGNLWFLACKADQNLTALGDWMRFLTVQGLFIHDWDTASTGSGGAYAGTPFHVFSIKNCRSVAITGHTHYHNSAATDTLIHFDGTGGDGNGNRFVTLDDIEITQIGAGATSFATGPVKFTGTNLNYRFDFISIPRYTSVNPLAIKPVFTLAAGATMPTLLLKPISAKSGAFSDASDIGTQEPGIPVGMAAIAGVDFTNGRLYVRYPDGTYHYATLT